MRAFSKGKSFTAVPSEHFIPGKRDREEMSEDRARAMKERREIPVFTEAYLYPRLGKGDARFVLAVAEEYEHIIGVLGPESIVKLLEQPVERHPRKRGTDG